MALTSVRVLLAGQWAELSYNPENGRYEGLVTPPGASATQPGGYYSLTVEAANDSGRTGRLSGDVFYPLRLVVKDMDAPTLTPVSPSEGFVATNRPTVVMSAADEPMGSGVAPETFSVYVDGVPVTDGLSWTAAAGGYRLVYTPAVDLAEGRHTICFTVADHAGNVGAAAVQYTVDTVPPRLSLRLPDSHRVVDDASILVAGDAADVTSGVESVTVAVDGMATPVAWSADGFAAVVPLSVAYNTITVTATDHAGLTASQSFFVIRLVTDRESADVERVQDLCRRGYAGWTEEERAWWASTRCRRGSYDDLDLNRVQLAMDHINGWLRAYGYAPAYQSQGGTWAQPDVCTGTVAGRYLANTAALRAALPLPADTPQVPVSMRRGYFHTREANNIERILVAVDAVRPNIDASPWMSGEMMSGEV